MRALPIICLFLLSCQTAPHAARQVSSFDECLAAGYAVTRSIPARCIAPGGEEFVEERAAPKPCEDLCGDGTCQEIVCMAVGCPCAETPQSCPKDCK